MRATAGTITEYPETEAALAPVEWINAGDMVVIYLSTADPEVVHGITTAVDDLLHPEVTLAPVYDMAVSGAIYTLKSRYSTNVERFNERLQNLVEHYGLADGILWTSGPARGVTA